MEGLGMRRIQIGTRGSRLALAQAELVKCRIEEIFPGIQAELVPIVTKGDKMLDRPLDQLGGKGAFTKELEEQLLDGRIDLAVHSAKDLPMELPKGLCIGAVTERANPVDVLVTRNGRKLSEWQEGMTVGTGSLRRMLQLQEINEKVRVKPIRGNIETRLKKLRDGQYDGVILAAAGMMRLKLQLDQQYQWEYLNTEEFLPAAGQGILAVECRTGALEEICQAIHSEKAGLMLEAEREFLKQMGGSCNAPAACICEKEGQALKLRAAYWLSTPEGYKKKMTEQTALLPEGETEEQHLLTARKLGRSAAEAVLQLKGADQGRPVGMVSLVGAGPGNWELLSIGALDRIRRADVLVYDHLIPAEALNEAKPGAELIYAGKRASCHHMKQEEINRLLVQKALEGARVVRLKGGDPLVFGRGAEEACACAEAGVAFEFLPGVSSAYSVPEYAGIPVTQRHLASSFHVITGQEGNHKEEPVLDYKVLSREEGTLVFLMGLKRTGEIADALIAGGKDGKTPAAVISRGTTGAQKCVEGSLETIGSAVQKARLETPSVLVVGDTVSLSGRLSWYGKKPLSGKRILLTGTKELSDRLAISLRDYGMEAVPFSLIRTEELESEEKEEAFRNLKDYSWAVFTSSSGVRQFFGQLSDRSIDRRCLSDMKFAVIGKGTGRTLKEYGLYPDFVPSVYTSAVLARELSDQIKPSEKVLLLRAAEGSRELPSLLKQQGISCTELAIYRQKAEEQKKEELMRQLPEADYVLFASPSAVRVFAACIGKQLPDRTKLLCIGPVTAAEVRKQGLSVYAVSEEYSSDGIVRLLLSEAEREDD